MGSFKLIKFVPWLPSFAAVIYILQRGYIASLPDLIPPPTGSNIRDPLTLIVWFGEAFFYWDGVTKCYTCGPSFKGWFLAAPIFLSTVFIFTYPALSLLIKNKVKSS